jgi:hypothetical protein
MTTSSPTAPLRWTLAVLCALSGAGTVLNIFSGSNGTGGGWLFGLWVASPLLAMAALETLLATTSRSSGSAPANAAQITAVAVLMLVTVGSQLIVTGNRSSTAAILYVFAPIYSVVLAAVGFGLGWLGGALASRARPDPRGGGPALG